MIIVCDTNVLVSASISPGGTSDEVLRQVLQGKCQMGTSWPLLKELRRVLREKIRVPEREVREFYKLVRENSQIFVPKESVLEIPHDPADNRVLECAIEARANYIISGDEKHLQPLEEFRGIPVMSPREFLEILV